MAITNHKGVMPIAGKSDSRFLRSWRCPKAWSIAGRPPPVPYVPQYYEKWLASLAGLVVKIDLVTAAETDSSKVATD
jgi:hypothetical protein